MVDAWVGSNTASLLPSKLRCVKRGGGSSSSSGKAEEKLEEGVVKLSVSHKNQKEFLFANQPRSWKGKRARCPIKLKHLFNTNSWADDECGCKRFRCYFNSILHLKPFSFYMLMHLPPLGDSICLNNNRAHEESASAQNLPALHYAILFSLFHSFLSCF